MIKFLVRCTNMLSSGSLRNDIFEQPEYSVQKTKWRCCHNFPQRPLTFNEQACDLILKHVSEVNKRMAAMVVSSLY